MMPHLKGLLLVLLFLYKESIYVFLFIQGKGDHPCAMYSDRFYISPKRPKMALFRGWGRLWKIFIFKGRSCDTLFEESLYPRHFGKRVSIIAINTSRLSYSKT